MSHIQISNTLVGYCWCVVKPFIAVLMLYSSSGGAVVLWGAPYTGWAQQTCMGLAMAGACAKHRPCYWSQTSCRHLLATETAWSVGYHRSGTDIRVPMAGVIPALRGWPGWNVVNTEWGNIRVHGTYHVKILPCLSSNGFERPHWLLHSVIFQRKIITMIT